MGGLTIEKMFIILGIAMIFLGPEKLPLYAQKLAVLVKNIRRMTMTAKERIQEEMGEDFTDEDWQQLDPRKYDPRKIIRDAINEDKREMDALLRQQKAKEAASARQERATVAGKKVPETVAEMAAADLAIATEGKPLPFDEEAT